MALSLKSTALRGIRAVHCIATHVPSFGSFQPLRGSFSAYEAVRNGKINGKILMERQEIGPCPVRSMTEKARFQQNDHQPWPVFWACAEDARLVGKMHHWRDPQDRICAESVYHLIERRRLGEDRLFAQVIVPRSQRLPGAWTGISSNWNDASNYFHWMLDGLTRLAVREFLPEKTRILIPERLPRFAKETLALLSLEGECEAFQHDCLQPERYYFCAPIAMTGVWNPMGYDWLRKSFSPYFCPQNSGAPIFLTRRGSSRLPSNLAKVEEILLKYGFEIIDCGKLSVKEQIQKVSAAPAIAGLHGAAMTNLLWATHSTPVLEIFEPDYLNGCYEQIALHGGLKYKHQVNGDSEDLTQLIAWCEKVSSTRC